MYGVESRWRNTRFLWSVIFHADKKDGIYQQTCLSRSENRFLNAVVRLDALVRLVIDTILQSRNRKLQLIT